MLPACTSLRLRRGHDPIPIPILIPIRIHIHIQIHIHIRTIMITQQSGRGLQRFWSDTPRGGHYCTLWCQTEILGGYSTL